MPCKAAAHRQQRRSAAASKTEAGPPCAGPSLTPMMRSRRCTQSRHRLDAALRQQADVSACENRQLHPAIVSGPAEPPWRTMKAAISATPLFSLRLENRNGRGAAHPARIAVHDVEVGADQRREVDLVDHQQVGAGDAGPALARDLLARRHVDHVDREVGQLGREGGGEIVAARFDEHDLELGPFAHDVRHRGEIDRGILADRGVRAAAGLDADDAVGLERAGARQELGVLLGVDVVGDDGDVVGRRASSCTGARPARSCPSRPDRPRPPARDRATPSMHLPRQQRDEAHAQRQAERRIEVEVAGAERLGREPRRASAGCSRPCRG